MKRSNFITIVIFALTLSLGAASSFAQSSDRDSPAALTSGNITGSLNDHDRESFYSFTAGPGAVSITVDVNARRDEQGVLNFDVLARNGATSIACCFFAQGEGGGTGGEVAYFRLARRQTVILHTKNGPIGGGTFNIRVTGAGTSFAAGSNGDGYGQGSGSDNDNDNDGGGRGDRGDRGDRGREQIEVPATGTLHIKMKNGTVQDINLSRVRNISIRP
jgi:hypothetical protein